MRKHNLLERIVAGALAIILAVPSSIGNFAVPAQAADADDEDTQPISISLDWVDSEFKDGAALNIKEGSSVSNAVAIKVSYESSLIREEGYAPGELIITVKGIGNVNRSGPIQALVGADKETAKVKTRDWSYTWNKANDTYTLTNNEEIKGNSVLSGYFELVWEIDARSSVDRYEQNGMQAVLYLPDGDSVSSNKLTFTNDTTADTFAVHIDRREMYSYEGLTKGIDNPDDYAFIRYNLGATDYLNSRGLKTNYYLFDPDSTDVGSGAIVISPKLSCKDMEDGTYRVSISAGASMENQYIFVAYPNTANAENGYTDKTVTASITKYGVHYEGDDETGNTEVRELATDSIDVPIPSNFKFSDIPGDIYDFWKDTYYDKHVSSSVIQARGGDVIGSKVRTGTTETFYLEGTLNNKDKGKYTMEIVDDFLYIMKNNSNFRQLEAGEYSFEKLTIPGTSSLLNINNIPIESNVYKAYVYTATDGEIIDTKNSSPVWKGVIKASEQSVTLPANTTAVAVVLQDIEENIRRFSIPVNVKFNVKDTTDLEIAEQDNLTSGQIVNTSFIKLYAKQEDDSYAWINGGFTANHYQDDTNLKLAQKDKDTYGSYLDRERDNITFYVGDKSDYRAYTHLSDILSEGNRFTTDLTMGANFNFKDDEYPNKFSLYTILDESLSLYGYKNEEDIWDIMTLKGLDMSATALAKACTPEVIKDYNGSGRTYIALHFDFGDKQVPQDSQIRATFELRVSTSLLKKSYSIPARSAVVIDKTILEYPVNKTTDTGSWGDAKDLFKDIDRDRKTDETLAYDFDSISHIYADSSQMQLTKYVKTTYSDGWAQQPDVPSEEYSGEYQYNLYMKNGNSQTTDIVITDILETGEKMQWQGTFQSVDLSECEEVGLTGTVYYSTKDNPAEDLSSSDWTTQKPEAVKAIAVDFGKSILKEGQELNVIVNMKAPEDTSLKNKITDNGFSASFTMMDSVTGNVTGSPDLDSNFVQVKLTPPLKTIQISKVDEENLESLDGAKFALIDKETGETIAEAVSNARGYATFRQIPADTTYILREIEAPYGYETVEDREITMNGESVRLNVKDPRKLGRVAVYKVNNLDDDIPVANAEYTLFDEKSNAVSTALTDDKGLAVFENIAWGKYTVKETASPAGYQLNETEYPVEINRETVSEPAIIDTTNIQDNVSVQLNKFVKKVDGTQTEEPIAGATFELYRKMAAGDWRVGLYVTDTEGRIDLIELPYGDYYFREYRAPMGYVAAENTAFTLSPENKDVSVTIYNQRKPGEILITKKDDLGNLVKDIEFSLYNKKDAESEPLAKTVTDEYGVAKFENLEWGTYYILETKAPECYNMDTEWKDVLVNGSHLTTTINVVNETKKGAIILTKTDEYSTPAMKQYLPGAEYALYKDDGTVIGTYTTVDKETTLEDGTVLQVGQLYAKDLEWGSYYFKETKAPAGYSLSDEMVRFSVNALNAGVTQEIEVSDPLDAKSITLIKKIKSSDVNFANGNPTFIFKVDGTDIHGEDHVYYRSVSFDEAYVKANTNNSGCVTLSTTIGELIAGEYTATEQETSRYALNGITEPVNGTVTDNKVVFHLTADENKEASAVFTNRNYEQQDFSDTQILMNVLKEKAKLTALKATYGFEKAEADTPVDHSILDVVAIYDDGSTKTLSEGNYNLSIDQFPNHNGDYTVKVTYTENGIERSSTFKVTLYGMKIRIIDLKATLKDDSGQLPGTQLTQDMFTVTALYNDNTSAELADFTVSPNVVPNAGGEFDVTINLDLNKVPNDGYPVNTTLKMPIKHPDPILVEGETFKALIPTTATAVEFTDELAPAGYVLGDAIADNTMIDVSDAGNGSVVAWLDGTTFKVSSQRGDIKVIANEDCENMFYSKSALTNINAAMLDTSEVTNMDSMFNGCSGLTTLEPISGWDTSKVTNMMSMFFSCSGLTTLEPIRSWDTSEVTNMRYMFGYCIGLTTLEPISGWDTSEVTNMSTMFNSCSQLTEIGDLSGWDTSEVTNMSNMFYKCSKVTSFDLSGWDTSKVTNMSSMFYKCSKVTSFDLSSWDTSEVTNMTTMFNYCNRTTEAYARSQADADRLNATLTYSWRFVSVAPVISINVNAPDTVTVNIPDLVEGGVTKFTLVPVEANKRITSFKLDGQTIEEDTFIAPMAEAGSEVTVTVSDIKFVDVVIIESAHNPYETSASGTYGEVTFSGATSLTVELECLMKQSTSYDYIYLYDSDGTKYGKYGGTTLTTKTVTIPGEYLRLEFKTNASSNDSYGFKAAITPNYE